MGRYYILKMDIAKYFDNIHKEILLNILKKKILDNDLLWLIEEILYAQKREKGLEIGNILGGLIKYYAKDNKKSIS